MNLDQAIATVTWFFHWGPHDALSLTGSELQWWDMWAGRLSGAASEATP